MVTNISSHDAATEIQCRVNKTRERLTGFAIGFSAIMCQASHVAFDKTTLSGLLPGVLLITILILGFYLPNRPWVNRLLHRYVQAQAGHSPALHRVLWWLFAGFAFSPLMLTAVSILRSNYAVPYPPVLALLFFPSIGLCSLIGIELLAFYHPPKIKPVASQPDRT